MCPRVENLRRKTPRNTENEKHTRHVPKNSKKNDHPRRKFATLENLPKTAKNLRPRKKTYRKNGQTLKNLQRKTRKTYEKWKDLQHHGKTYRKNRQAQKNLQKKSKKLQKVEKLTTPWKNLQKK